MGGDVIPPREGPTAEGTVTFSVEGVAPAVMSVNKGAGVAVTVGELAKTGEAPGNSAETLKEGLSSTAGAGDTVLGLSWGEAVEFNGSLTNPPLVKDPAWFGVSLT